MKKRRQLRRAASYRNVTTGETSIRFQDILPRKLTLRRKFNRAEGMTLFHEVEVVPFDERLNQRERELMSMRPAHGRKMTPAEFFEIWLMHLELAVADLWIPRKFHLVLHSSGWDSRVLSLVLRRLSGRLGSDWLGDVLFACYGCEAPAHRAAMECEGWDEHQYMEIVDVVLLFRKLLDFDNAWTWINNVKPGLSLSVIFVREMLERHGINPRSAQLWYGYYGNTTDRLCGKKNLLYRRTRNQYESPSSTSVYDIDDVNDMFGHYDVLEYVIRARAPVTAKRSLLRQQLLRQVAPELARIPEIQLKDDFPLVPHELARQAKLDYTASWYGRMVHPDGVRQSTRHAEHYHGWWNIWSRAALCEHLLREGYEIEIE